MAVDRLETPKRPIPYSHSRTHSHTPAHTLGTADLKLHNAHTKGKQRETEDFRFGWYDFVPVLESRQPPVQWTSSSLIITAHASEPRVVCLHFPSNRHFILPSPPPLVTPPASYEPPAIIVASSRDDWIFAYFPGIDIDGVGCFWNKSRLVDDWTVKEWRAFARGDGIVAARWLNPDREWSSSESGMPTRLPALGPFIPSLYPVLLTVTESHLCNVSYLNPQTDRVHTLSASLSRRSFSKDDQDRPVGELVDGPRGLGRCVHAAIGLGYDESSVLVSTYSSFVPSTAYETRPRSSTDINLSLPIPPSDEPRLTSGWETWRDENVIEICEVNITINGFLLTLGTTPLPSIRDFPQSGRCLTSMTFAPCLSSSNSHTMFPSTPTQTHRRVTPQSSPVTIPAYISQSPGRSVLRSPIKGAAPKPVLEKAKGKPSGPLYLLCTTLEVGQYTSAPTSDVILYVFWRNPVDVQTWYFRRASQLTLSASVVAHLSPYQPINTATNASVLLGILNHEGQIVKQKGEQRLTVGKLQILRLPELQIDDSCESVNLVCPIGSCGVELPFGFAASPNRTLVCAIPASHLVSSSPKATTFIHQHPMRALHAGQDSGPQRTRKPLAASMEIALQRRFFLGDIVHSLCTPNTPISSVDDTLSAVLLAFDANIAAMTRMWVNEIIGVAIEIYRKRSISTRLGAEIDDLTSRYQTGLEICSLSACNVVWEDTFDYRGYDPDAVWNLTSLCVFFVEEVLEKLLKECVQFASEVTFAENSSGSTDATKASTVPGDESSKEGTPSACQNAPSLHMSSSLLHLVHPYALDIFHSFVQHVRRFRGFFGSNSLPEEHHQVAREILIDAVDSSPVDLESLDRVLSEIKSEVLTYAEQSPELARRSLASLKPAAQYTPLLRKIVVKMMHARVVDKLQLFIKPAELVDGMLGLLMSSSGKTHERDVITKGYLIGQGQQLCCLRCGGKSEIDGQVNGIPGHSSARWAVWERTWQTHCVCGGLWSSRT